MAEIECFFDCSSPWTYFAFQSLRAMRDEIGLDNIRLMVPFCRTNAEADAVLAALADALFGKRLVPARVPVAARVRR